MIAPPVLLRMIHLNIPLHTWELFSAAQPKESSNPGYERQRDFGDKQLDRIAGMIVAGLTHEAVIALVVREWDLLPSVVRMRVTQLANERFCMPSSHNVAKGIGKLNRLLGGKILGQAEQVTVRDLRVIDGKLTSQQRAVRPGVVGASRAFAAFVKPRDYDSWSPERKRRWQQQMAKERRERKGI